MEHVNYFDNFLKNYVNLNKSRLDLLEQKVETITNFLGDGLDGYRKYSPQGSFAQGTIIKPVRDNDEFDADILIFIRDNNFDPNEYDMDYVKKVHDLFKNDDTYKNMVSLKTRCVTIDYANDFHLDIVPCIEYGEETYICNRTDKKYEQTDGDGYRKWLSEKNKIATGNYLKKSTRLFKFLRDHKDNFTIKSILLTTTLGMKVNEFEKNSSEFSNLPKTFKTLFNRMNDFLQDNPTMPTIKNPALPCEDFNRNWDEEKYQNFRTKIKIYNDKVNDAFDEEDRNKSVQKWRALFGDDFGTLKDSEATTNSGATGAALGLGVTPKNVIAKKPHNP